MILLLTFNHLHVRAASIKNDDFTFIATLKPVFAKCKSNKNERKFKKKGKLKQHYVIETIMQE